MDDPIPVFSKEKGNSFSIDMTKTIRKYKLIHQEPQTHIWTPEYILFVITHFKLTCKTHVRNSFIENWTHQINDIHTNPIVRTYAIFKHSFGLEPYLKQISNTRYRNAITRLRVSSHSLAFERGRHLGTALQEIFCNVCNVIEDEKHFLFECCINEELIFIFNSRVSQLYPQYQYFDSDQKLIFLFEIENEQLITWVEKVVYNSFCLREEYHGNRD